VTVYGYNSDRSTFHFSGVTEWLPTTALSRHFQERLGIDGHGKADAVISENRYANAGA
jgi:hypothetical protein